jgi:hypothetical protein
MIDRILIPDRSRMSGTLGHSVSQKPPRIDKLPGLKPKVQASKRNLSSPWMVSKFSSLPLKLLSVDRVQFPDCQAGAL